MLHLLKASTFRTTTALSRSAPRTGSVGVRAMSEHSARHGNDPEIIGKNKQSLLGTHAKGSTEEPRWHEELASDAEAFVKAERGEIECSEVEITKLEEMTKKKFHPKTSQDGEKELRA